MATLCLKSKNRPGILTTGCFSGKLSAPPRLCGGFLLLVLGERMTRRAFLSLVCLVLCVLNASAQERFENVSRIVAVGDVHGGFEELVSVLRSADVLDDK